MCDTLGVLLPDGAIFGKNSDRSPNEAQVLEYHPPRVYDERELRATYLTIPQASETLGVLLSRPVWMWGAEIGVNEAGVCIGNEAVFTRGGYGKPALTGMDLLRLALERAQSAERAVETITALLETYGQGGNCGYDHPFTYDNSFLVLDRSRLYVLETAGKRWVAKSYPRTSISNRLSIGADGDRYGGGVCDFRKRYTDPLYTFFSRSARRQGQTCAALGAIARPADMARALRTHTPGLQNPFTHGSVGSCCMHYGKAVGDHTTASMIVSLGAKSTDVYVTGASTPCVSLYKPWRFGGALHAPFIAPDDRAGEAYWRGAERFRRALIGKSIPPALYLERDAFEQTWFTEMAAADTPEAADVLLTRALAEEAAFYARFDPAAFPAAEAKLAYMTRWNAKNAVFEKESARFGADA